MAHKKITDVRQYATGTGAGALTLAATAISANYRTMQAAGMENADTAYVMIRHATIPSQWEIVLVAYTASGTTITPSFDSRSVSATGSIISFSAGNKIVSEARHDGVDWIIDIVTGPANVADFGAVADGVTDSLAAFDAAIVAGNGAIFIPPGDYLLSGPLAVSMRQISIVGEGAGKSNIKFASGGGIEITVPSSPYGQYANTRVAHLSLISDGTGDVGLKIVDDGAVTDNRITIEDIEFIGSDGPYGPTQSVTGTSHSSTLIDGIADTSAILVNSVLTSGSGITQTNTYVVSKTANSVTLNTALSTSTTGTFTFNAGPQKYWNRAIELNGVRHAYVANIRANGGGAGKSEQAIYLTSPDDGSKAQFDFSFKYIIANYWTVGLETDGWTEGVYIDSCNFYASRDALVANHATGTVVGTFAATNTAFFCSRSPIVTSRIAGIQLTNNFIVRGFNESAWNPADSGVISGAGGFSYPGSLIDITGSGGSTNYDGHTISNNNFFSAGTSTNVILLTDVFGATIDSNFVWGGSFTNGINFAGTTENVTCDNMVAGFTSITNPIVRGGSSGRNVTGTFLLNENYVTDFQQKTFESEAGSTVPAFAMTGDIDEAKWLFAGAGSFSLALYNDRASQPSVAGLSTITYKSRTFSARAQMLSDGGLKQAAYFETQAIANAPGLAMTGDIDEAKWLTALGSFNLTFYNDRESQPDIDGSSTIAHGGRTYYARCQMQSDGGFRIAGDFIAEGDMEAAGSLIAYNFVASPVLANIPMTVADLPAASSFPGGIAYVTDSTVDLATGFNNPVSGGGSNAVGVRSNGTVWYISG